MICPQRDHNAEINDDEELMKRNTPRLRIHALALICLLVKDDIIHHNVEIEETIEVRIMFKNSFKFKRNIQHMFLKNRLHSLHLEEGASLFKILKEVQEITNQLRAISECISVGEII